MPGTRRRTRTHSMSGAASVEAALVLPVFAIALLGVIFLHHLYAAQSDARMLARRCGLEYAMLGCERIPPGCDGVLSATELAANHTEARDLRRTAGRGDSFGVLDLPVIGDAIDALFGTATRAHTGRSVAFPWGGRKASVSSEYVVLCNEHPRDIGAAIERVFCDLVPVVKCR